jgi:glycosyltransferase involved in cell wall biosynthesis
MDSQRRYLVVVSAPSRRLGPTTFAMDGAFGEHLRLLMKELEGDFAELVLASPEFTAEEYERVKGAYTVVDEQREPIRFVRIYNTTDSTAQAMLTLGRVVSLVKEADFVHTHLADPRRPHPVVAGAAAMALKKPVMTVTDLDHRGYAKRERAAGRMGWKDYVFRRLCLEPVTELEQRAYARWADLVLFKELHQSADYGGGQRPNVRFFLDPNYSAEQVIAPADLDRKLERLTDRAQPLRVVFFGRLVDFKGVDWMIDIVARARRAGARLTFDIMGNGPEQPRLEQLVREHQLEVNWVPPVPYGEGFLDVVRRYDLLLACPLAADTARTAWDAVASGLALLAFDTNYYKNVAAVTGAVDVTPWRDAQAMADRLVAIAADKAALAPRIRRAVEIARANPTEVWLRRRADWVREMVAGKPLGPNPGVPANDDDGDVGKMGSGARSAAA